MSYWWAGVLYNGLAGTGRRRSRPEPTPLLGIISRRQPRPALTETSTALAPAY